LIEPDPGDWGGCVPYLLEKLEEEAQRRGMRDIYKEMLGSLQLDIGNRISLG
jgi:hypothetical protein